MTNLKTTKVPIDFAKQCDNRAREIFDDRSNYGRSFNECLGEIYMTALHAGILEGKMAMEAETTPMHTIHGNSIQNGTKFIAFFGDGSCAKLFLISDDGELADAENGFIGITAPDTWLQDAGFYFWMKLPDNFKLWFEQN